MFWPFRRTKRASVDSDLAPRISALERRIAEFADRLAEEEQKAFAFRGRVYAYLGRKGVKLKEETDAPDTFDPRTAPLDDPRLTKAQIKERLGLSTPAGIARHLRN